MTTLPDEIWALIFSFVCWNADIKAILLTSRLFNSLIASAAWSAICIDILPTLDETFISRRTKLVVIEDIVPSLKRRLVRRVRLSKQDGWHCEPCWDFKDFLAQFNKLDHLSLDVPVYRLKVLETLRLTSLSLDFCRLRALQRPTVYAEGWRDFLEGGNPEVIEVLLSIVKWEQGGLLTLLTLPTLRRLAIRNATRFFTLMILNLKLAERSLPITHLSLYDVDTEAQKGVIHLIKAIKQLSCIKIGLSCSNGIRVRANVIASTVDLPQALRLHRETLRELVITYAIRLQGPYHAAAPLSRWNFADFPNIQRLYLPAEYLAWMDYNRRIPRSVVRLGLTTSLHSERYDNLPIG